MESRVDLLQLDLFRLIREFMGALAEEVIVHLKQGTTEGFLNSERCIFFDQKAALINARNAFDQMQSDDPDWDIIQSNMDEIKELIQ